MTPSYKTIIPTFDVSVFAQEADSESQYRCATIVPPFNVAQYAQAVVVPEEVHKAEEEPEEELLGALLDETLVRRPLEIDSTFVLSHRAAFVLLHVDGVSTVRQIVDRCGIPRDEALGTLTVLLHRGLVGVAHADDGEGPKSGLRRM